MSAKIHDASHCPSVATLAAKLEAEEKLRMEADRRYEDRFSAQGLALEKNATEVLRRLEELNHAHAQARQDWERSLPREVFGAFQESTTKWKETSIADLARLATRTEELAINLRTTTEEKATEVLRIAEDKAAANTKFTVWIGIALAALTLALKYLVK